MERLVGGDVNALGELFTRYQRDLFAFLYRLLEDAETAEDLVQESFLRVYERRNTFRPQGRFKTWLYAIAKHLAGDELRRRRRHRTLLFLAAEESETFEETLQRRALQRQVRAALRKLPLAQRLALLLHEYHGFSYAEIGTVLGCTENTARIRAYRARQRVRETLVAFEEASEDEM